MNDILSGASGDDGGDIWAQQIIENWIKGKTIKQISEETGWPIATVNRILKRMQKEIVKREDNR
jgi:hypothetical protein